ncbi:hypothetical protein NDU88_002035 [Pleurodeles waltl]|uniref:Uncharacterized protein n=1 Tax=Pleurodeles waltl TaxID=8319 RepID=A0AAV7LB73_PLEWA|nr:hypothetical protein NDU88_002035 [Pleurodeles waltl]
MFSRLTTSRPIRIEDGRDVGGWRGRDGREARTSAVLRAGRLLVGLVSCGKTIKDITMQPGCLASFIPATTNGDEGHSFYQGPQV